MLGWKAIATYGYTDTIVTEDNEIPEGQRLDGTPEHSASLWTIYEMQKGSLQGLGFGLGLTFLGDREAQIPNSINKVIGILSVLFLKTIAVTGVGITF